MTERIKRKKFKSRVCAADGCRERFVPDRESHIYHAKKCATYMRVKRWRGEKPEAEQPTSTQEK